MQKWQYLVVVQRGMHVRVGAGDALKEHKIQDFLDTCGADGWELVTTESLGDPDKTFLLYLKRPALSEVLSDAIG